jgi:hypothetical protein
MRGYSRADLPYEQPRSPTSDDRPRPLDSGFPRWRQATWRRRTGTDAAGLETEALRLVAHPGWKFARLTAGGGSHERTRL